MTRRSVWFSFTGAILLVTHMRIIISIMLEKRLINVVQLHVAPLEATDFDLILLWIHSEKELKQWASPIMFHWPR